MDTPTDTELAQRLAGVYELGAHTIATLCNYAQLPFLSVHDSDKELIAEALERAIRKIIRRTAGRQRCLRQQEGSPTPWPGQAPFTGDLSSIQAQAHGIAFPHSKRGRPRTLDKSVWGMLGFIEDALADLDNEPGPADVAQQARHLAEWLRMARCRGVDDEQAIEDVREVLARPYLDRRGKARRLMALFFGVDEKTVRRTEE